MDASHARCGSCGRSLVAAPPKTGHNFNHGAPLDQNNDSSFKLSEQFVNIAVGATWGIGGLVFAFFVFRRFLMGPSGSASMWYAVMLLSFCGPAIYGFMRSYGQDQKAKQRAKQGLPDYQPNTAMEKGSAPTKVPDLYTPYETREKLGYLEAGYVLDAQMLQEWDGDTLKDVAKDKAAMAGQLNRVLQHGDSQPAVVVYADRKVIIVSAYSDDFDGYVYLGFVGDARERLIKQGYGDVASQLVCNWLYWETNIIGQKDVLYGKNNSGKFTAGWPVLANLITRDRPRLKAIQDAFGDSMYAHVMDGSLEYMRRVRIASVRNGTPLRSLDEYLDVAISL